jgi:hypothetical protein
LLINPTAAAAHDLSTGLYYILVYLLVSQVSIGTIANGGTTAAHIALAFIFKNKKIPLGY